MKSYSIPFWHWQHQTVWKQILLQKCWGKGLEHRLARNKMTIFLWSKIHIWQLIYFLQRKFFKISTYSKLINSGIKWRILGLKITLRTCFLFYIFSSNSCFDKTQDHDLFISSKRKKAALKMNLKSSIMSKLHRQMSIIWIEVACPLL